MKDVIIIGAGPCGLSAAMECQRQGLSSLIIEKTLLSTPFICIRPACSSSVQPLYWRLVMYLLPHPMTSLTAMKHSSITAAPPSSMG